MPSILKNPILLLIKVVSEVNNGKLNCIVKYNNEVLLYDVISEKVGFIMVLGQ